MFGELTWLGGKPAAAGIFQVERDSSGMPVAYEQTEQTVVKPRSNLIFWGVAILGGGGLLLYALLRK